MLVEPLPSTHDAQALLHGHVKETKMRGEKSHTCFQMKAHTGVKGPGVMMPQFTQTPMGCPGARYSQHHATDNVLTAKEKM